MIRISIICTFFFFLQFQVIIAQSVQVSYLKVENNTEKLELMEEKYKHLHQDIKKDFAEMINLQEYYTLHYSNGESVFFLDEEKSEVPKNAELNFSNVTVQVIQQKSKINPRIYKNFTKKTIVELKDVFGKGFIVRDSMAIDWQFHSEKKMVGGQLCAKATSQWKDMEVEAWYSEDIPITDGPSIFSGLPGLVLELKTPKFNYTASKVHFTKKPASIEIPNGWPEMSINEFDAMYIKKVNQLYPEGSSITVY